MSWHPENLLTVNVSRKQGEEKIVNPGELFNQNPNQIVIVGGTVNEDGWFNIAPICLIYAKGNTTRLSALLKGDSTADNVIKNGKLTLRS